MGDVKPPKRIRWRPQSCLNRSRTNQFWANPRNSCRIGDATRAFRRTLAFEGCTAPCASSDPDGLRSNSDKHSPLRPTRSLLTSGYREGNAGAANSVDRVLRQMSDALSAKEPCSRPSLSNPSVPGQTNCTFEIAIVEYFQSFI